MSDVLDDWRALLADVDAATGPDQMLSLKVRDLVYPGQHFQDFAGSLDAVTALIEREMPGWRRQLFERDEHQWIARIISPRSDCFATDDESLGLTPARLPALAFLAVFICAKVAELEQERAA